MPRECAHRPQLVISYHPNVLFLRGVVTLHSHMREHGRASFLPGLDPESERKAVKRQNAAIEEAKSRHNQEMWATLCEEEPPRNLAKLIGNVIIAVLTLISCGIPWYVAGAFGALAILANRAAFSFGERK
jgi:hypothetical protein